MSWSPLGISKLTVEATYCGDTRRVSQVGYVAKATSIFELLKMTER